MQERCLCRQVGEREVPGFISLVLATRPLRPQGGVGRL